MPVDAVIFDWGGTLTRWHDVDFHAESLALAQAVVNAPHHDAGRAHRPRLHAAGAAVWGRSRDHQQSATVADLFAEAGLDHDPELLTAYYEFWEPHTVTDPEVGPLFEALRARRDQGRRALQHDLAAGVARGLLRARRRAPPDRRRRLHQRDPVDQAVRRRRSGRRWRRSASTDPARCVYVGDRLFDDVWGAHNAGLRAIHIPHSAIPPSRSATPRASRTPSRTGCPRSPTSSRLAWRLTVLV